jgi:hypothetical protein
MNITLVLSVYNKLNLTKNFYTSLREKYPYAPLVISSGGSTDDTKEWLESLSDKNLTYVHTDERLSFSENYNKAISLVETDKLVLVHNDMIIGEQFLENLDEMITEDTLLSYLTIEPPVFAVHIRPGKILMDFGDSFENFNHKKFNEYVEMNKNKKTTYNGAVFFMSGYKKLFDDVGGFDGVTFKPAFCEDDDFLIRTKLKGYKLKTTNCAITYHFVSRTSRDVSTDPNEKQKIEWSSNKNFIRKWGVPNNFFISKNYWDIDDFKYTRKKYGLVIKGFTQNQYYFDFEPYFDKILTDVVPEKYINEEQPWSSIDLMQKFKNTDDVDVVLTLTTSVIQTTDLRQVCDLKDNVNNFPAGKYKYGNFIVEIK